MDQNDWLHSLLGEMDTAWQEVTRGLGKTMLWCTYAVHVSKSGPKMLLMDMFYSVTLTAACTTRFLRRSSPLADYCMYNTSKW